MYKIFATIFALFLAYSSSASVLVIHNQLGTNYTMYLNGEKYEHSSKEHTLINSINDVSVTLNIVIKGDKLLNVFEKLELKSDKYYTYKLYYKGKKAKLSEEESGNIADFKQPTENFELFKYGNIKPISSYINNSKSTGQGTSSMTMERTPTIKKETDSSTVTESYTKKKQSETKESSTEISNVKTQRESEYAVAVMEVPTDCKKAIDKKEFEKILTLINDVTEPNAKLGTAKRNLSNICINTDQLAQVLKALPLESDRIELGRKAYLHLVDKENFSQVESAFETKAAYKAVEQYIEIKYGN